MFVSGPREPNIEAIIKRAVDKAGTVNTLFVHSTITVWCAMPFFKLIF
ncbi:conserved hypothetical protein [Xenorhabdus nematophila F1]|uniref:Uncharacterized protein n=1 Tax=Xenorhabdus nematophila (strain ATCC 19061 / DSM 3370 / CCUG 14189 / LMG 1036 / NCIMB 9965 / AN6) TaxID=406817 RepID=D3VD38_XENNA|nr:hypothetical protein XNC1_1844 [Xenorhabdus nematophila ATCC 19061]CCW30040.1 conserved hypothetical protein [Xenorhabdus nematophila F1]CCW30114.1 conserved hypothetical protein [Xenorhabdus nematophila F1]CEE95864.1 hypothetical protein XNA1_720025 [Xenorhabdus nematophila str. Anatoliense]CEK22783.1 hypothetical protein XNC2_1788 [Xenorhabdus nematophila AN6/1]